MFAQKGQVAFDQQCFDDGATGNAHVTEIAEQLFRQRYHIEADIFGLQRAVRFIDEWRLGERLTEIGDRRARPWSHARRVEELIGGITDRLLRLARRQPLTVTHHVDEVQHDTQEQTDARAERVDQPPGAHPLGVVRGQPDRLLDVRVDFEEL